MLTQQVRGCLIDRDRGLPVGIGEVGHRRPDVHTCTVDQYIELTELLVHGATQPVDLATLGKIGDDVRSLGAAGSKGLGAGRQSLLTAGGDHHPRADSRQGSGDRESDA